MDINYTHAVLALIVVLALIWVIATVARRLGLSMLPMPRRGQRRRLGIVEVMTLDAKRRLVLVRRDETEHLVLLGAGSEMLVEGGIPAPEDTAGLATEPEAARPLSRPSSLATARSPRPAANEDRA